jgi:hypothetical protein
MIQLAQKLHFHSRTETILFSSPIWLQAFHFRPLPTSDTTTGSRERRPPSTAGTTEQHHP